MSIRDRRRHLRDQVEDVSPRQCCTGRFLSFHPRKSSTFYIKIRQISSKGLRAGNIQISSMRGNRRLRLLILANAAGEKSLASPRIRKHPVAYNKSAVITGGSRNP